MNALPRTRNPSPRAGAPRSALRRLPAPQPRLRLVRPGAPSGPIGQTEGAVATAAGSAAPIGLVLLDGLPGLLDAPGAGEADHG